MPLPSPNIQWPPEDWAKIYDLYAEHAAWYSGDPERLAKVYSEKVYSPTPRGAHWAKDITEERRTMLHIPIAGDIAAMSSDLLFSESPKIKIPGDGADMKKTQARVDEIINETNIYSRLVEAAETGAALGGIFLKVNWDSELSKYPLLSIAQADNAVPEFSFGLMTAVTFWRELPTDDDKVYRLLERHERGVILNGLYRGSIDYLGEVLPLTYRSETEKLPEVIRTGLDGLACVYIPNMRPNRRFRGMAIGQSDYSGSEGLMDSLDEVYTSWMRDIRLGQGRLIVPDMWLQRDNDGRMLFDTDREIFTSLDVDPMSAEKTGITISQFGIRTQEHQTTAIELLDRIISTAGYSPQSFGLKIEGRSESGTALNIRERRSFITSTKKQRYWKPAIEQAIYMLLQIDRLQLNSGVMPIKPVVEMQDSIQTDPRQAAETVEILNRAQALTLETKVRMVHPDWSPEQVKAEVELLKAEQGLGVPDPIQTGIA